MRDLLRIMESASASGFNVEFVVEELISEMRQALIVQSEDYVERYNGAMNDDLIEGPELDPFMERGCGASQSSSSSCTDVSLKPISNFMRG